MSRKKSVRKHREYGAQLKEEAVQSLWYGYYVHAVLRHAAFLSPSPIREKC